jgi:hypothetical protein
VPGLAKYRLRLDLVLERQRARLDDDTPLDARCREVAGGGEKRRGAGQARDDDGRSAGERGEVVGDLDAVGGKLRRNRSRASRRPRGCAPWRRP